eukprot:scaffold4829_cov64-Attheya_sp.AAC.1
MTTSKPFYPAAVYQAIAALAVMLAVVFAGTTYWIKLDLQKKRRTVAEEQHGKVVRTRDLHGPVVGDLVVIVGLTACQAWRSATLGTSAMLAVQPAFHPQIMFASVFAWFASGALALYAFVTIGDAASFDYFGPMRVVGYDVTIRRDDDYEKRVYQYNSDGHCEVVQIDLKVAFGASWACPDLADDSDLECINTAKDQMFNCHLCGGLYNVSTAAEAASGYCVQGLIGDETLALLAAGAQYDASVSPELDENGWKYVNAYGDCNSCSVQSDVYGSYRGRAQLMGIFSLIFFSVSGILLLWVWRQNKRGKTAHQQHQQQQGVGGNYGGTETTVELLSRED